MASFVCLTGVSARDVLARTVTVPFPSRFFSTGPFVSGLAAHCFYKFHGNSEVLLEGGRRFFI